jgi:nitrogen fixation protein NifB
MMSVSIAESEKFRHLVKRHPCYNPEAHGKHGRIHLPVSPGCNIRCRFCKREFISVDERPGVSRSVLTPQEALDTVGRALLICPEITVVGVAGPGDPLATDHALETLSLVHCRYPELIGCLSTNGLLLPDKAAQIVEAGVRTVTVTVNAVDADILPLMCGGVVLNSEFHTGKHAAEALIHAQLTGIKRISELGLVVKINTVLAPGVNDAHVEEIARVTAASGASLINVMPLIPQHELAYLSAPDCGELNKAREAAEKHLPVFRHCRHCRADACGIPGGADLADALYDKRFDTFSHG